MTYWGYQSEEAIPIVSGEHLDALMAIYGCEATKETHRRILREIRRVLDETNEEV